MSPKHISNNTKSKFNLINFSNSVVEACKQVRPDPWPTGHPTRGLFSGSENSRLLVSPNNDLAESVSRRMRASRVLVSWIRVSGWTSHGSLALKPRSRDSEVRGSGSIEFVSATYQCTSIYLPRLGTCCALIHWCIRLQELLLAKHNNRNNVFSKCNSLTSGGCI